MNNHRPILLVEDNSSDIELTKRAFAKARIANELLIAEDGEEALAHLLDENEPLPAVVLLDLKLPKIPGLEVLRRIRADARISHLPVVILTSSREEQDLVAGYQGGANSYVVKPVDFQQFQRSIEQLGLYWLVLNEVPPR